MLFYNFYLENKFDKKHKLSNNYKQYISTKNWDDQSSLKLYKSRSISLLELYQNNYLAYKTT